MCRFTAKAVPITLSNRIKAEASRASNADTGCSHSSMARRESPDAVVPDDRLKAFIYTQVSRGYLGMDALQRVINGDICYSTLRHKTVIQYFSYLIFNSL